MAVLQWKQKCQKITVTVLLQLVATRKGPLVYLQILLDSLTCLLCLSYSSLFFIQFSVSCAANALQVEMFVLNYRWLRRTKIGAVNWDDFELAGADL